MSWIAWTLVVVGVLVLLVLAALSSPLRLRGRVDEHGPAGGVGWLGVDVDLDVAPVGGARTIDVRLLGVRLVRRPIPAASAGEARGDRDSGERDSGDRASGDDAKRRRRRARPRLSLASWRVLVRTALRETRRSVRAVRVERLGLDAVVASDDPALTGELFGYGCALASVARGRWPGAELRLDVDFEDDRPRGRAELAIRVRPIRLVGSAARVAWVFRRERRRSARAA